MTDPTQEVFAWGIFEQSNVPTEGAIHDERSRCHFSKKSHVSKNLFFYYIKTANYKKSCNAVTAHIVQARMVLLLELYEFLFSEQVSCETQ